MNLRERVEQALQEARPALKADGGDVELIELRGDVAVVKLTGACHGCPSAGITLKNLVAKAIQARCPEIRAVEEVGGAHQAPAPHTPPKDAFADQQKLPGVGAVVVVASGKGGVGKSTVAVNLALALAQGGKRVGLLDADIYSPSIPTMLGVTSHPNTDETGVDPVDQYGLKLMSIGFFLDARQPVIWRGPMVMKAIDQFLTDVRWGELDILVVDLPPGTGDAQLTLVQKVPVDGAVVVTTPSDVALIDAQRAVGMFAQVHVPVIGIVENMSFFICPHCKQRTEVFSHGGGKVVADGMQAPFLGEIPLDPLIRSGGDQGRPVVQADPTGPQAKAFGALAQGVLDYLAAKQAKQASAR
jgi:ATP-binding protein involved in chromosome partitioning